MLNTDLVEPHFSKEWWPKFKPWFETEYASDVYKTLQSRSKEGKKIFPESHNTFKAFRLTSPKNIRAIIVGLSPYHTLGANKMPNADGLAFSCSLSNEEQPSLKLFVDAIQKDVGKKFTRPTDLTYLAEQGVLLLNYSFTSELFKPTIHADMNLWSNFNKFLYTEVLASYCGMPILLCGKQAHTIERLLFKMCHVVKKIEHPAAAARDHRSWNHDGAFNWINSVIKENNGEYSVIEWDYDVWGDTPW